MKIDDEIDLILPALAKLVVDKWPSSHLLVNKDTKIIKVPAMDMTYQSTVRTVQIIVHMTWN